MSPYHGWSGWHVGMEQMQVVCRLKQMQSSPASPQCHCEASCSGESSSTLLAPTLQTLTAWRETPFASRSHGMMMLSRWLYGKLARQASPGQSLTILLHLCCHGYLASVQHAAAVGIWVSRSACRHNRMPVCASMSRFESWYPVPCIQPNWLAGVTSISWLCTLMSHLSKECSIFEMSSGLTVLMRLPSACIACRVTS